MGHFERQGSSTSSRNEPLNRSMYVLRRRSSLCACGWRDAVCRRCWRRAGFRAGTPFRYTGRFAGMTSGSDVARSCFPGRRPPGARIMSVAQARAYSRRTMSPTWPLQRPPGKPGACSRASGGRKSVPGKRPGGWPFYSRKHDDFGHRKPLLDRRKFVRTFALQLGTTMLRSANIIL